LSSCHFVSRHWFPINYIEDHSDDIVFDNLLTSTEKSDKLYDHHFGDFTMANKVGKIKDGMGGSRNGRGRYEKTEVLKKQSRKLRRLLGRLMARESIAH